MIVRYFAVDIILKNDWPVKRHAGLQIAKLPIVEHLGLATPTYWIICLSLGNLATHALFDPVWTRLAIIFGAAPRTRLRTNREVPAFHIEQPIF